MKRIKGNTKLIVGLVFGIFISAVTSYAVAETLIKSADVSYVDNSKLGATNVQAAIDGTCTKFSNELSSFLNKIYPVGSIYISTANTNPSTFLGGTWENYADGRVLKGIKSGTAGTTGGSSTVTLSTANLPAHTHTFTPSGSVSSSFTGTAVNTGIQSANHTHTFSGTTSENGNHTHPQDLVKMAGAGSQYELINAFGTYPTAGLRYNNIMGSAGNHTHTYSGTTSTESTDHTHSVTAKGTVSSTFTGKADSTGSAGSSNPTAISVQDPYVTVYMWRRTK